MSCNETDNAISGDCTFKISTANQMLLDALIKYAMMLDLVTNAEEIERLNVDGVINSLLAEGMTKRVKDLAKRHGFDASSDFVESLNLCKDGEEVKAVVRDQELEMLKKTHDEILSHIPLEDSQKKFEF